MKRTTERCPDAFHADTISAKSASTVWHRRPTQPTASSAGTTSRPRKGDRRKTCSTECLWIALEIFTRLHQDDFQDMDAVTRLAQDFQALSHDVPGEDKRDSIRRAVETWLEMGDEEFSRQLAERVCNESNVEFTAPVVELIAIRARRRSRLQWCSYLLGGGIHSQGIRLRTEGEPQKGREAST